MLRDLYLNTFKLQRKMSDIIFKTNEESDAVYLILKGEF